LTAIPLAHFFVKSLIKWTVFAINPVKFLGVQTFHTMENILLGNEETVGGTEGF
jgi:hypothetical protein